MAEYFHCARPPNCDHQTIHTLASVFLYPSIYPSLSLLFHLAPRPFLSFCARARYLLSFSRFPDLFLASFYLIFLRFLQNIYIRSAVNSMEMRAAATASVYRVTAAVGTVYGIRNRANISITGHTAVPRTTVNCRSYTIRGAHGRSFHVSRFTALDSIRQ